MRKGIVIKSTGSWYSVLFDNGEQLACRMRGKIRIAGIRSTNPVAVGDRVEVDIEGNDGIITGILPRRNYIIRKSTNLSKESHIIAANVDQALLVVTVANPETSTVFIDRFLATAEAYNIPAVLVFNKIDLYDEEQYAYMMGLTAIYTAIGYKCIHCSTITGRGIDQVATLLQDKITVLSGLSGVGKSSLINKIEPGLNLKTALISDAHKSGKHTTTFAEMFTLSTGGFIVDTPGVRSFGTIDMSKQELSHFFPEIFAYSDACRFNNCTHTHEPGCAVREAVEEDKISESRYCSYLSMYEEEEEDKYRK